MALLAFGLKRDASSIGDFSYSEHAFACARAARRTKKRKGSHNKIQALAECLPTASASLAPLKNDKGSSGNSHIEGAD